MARTQAPEYEERREAIVQHAADLFATAGFSETSLADLAKACGYSKSLVYYYYPSKEEILFAVMSSHVDVLLEDVRIIAEAGHSPPKALAALVHTFMAHYVGAASRQKVLLNELGSLPDDKREIIVGKQRRIIQAVQDLVAAVDPTLAKDPPRSRLKTMLLFGMINWTHTWFNPAGPLSPDDVAEMVNELIGVGNKTRKRPARS
ncbi:MAG: TetR/AcrR family transcriptional regulator [Phenylobacterium sp.]|uniref:TetR/AcrR family transcriptional regulator n=1 Tax=Phenylobacterium sp. TaxID=1871053 RepID=UPI0025E5CCCD|nr:TetR/AcrR family transcriptional regulator [Phenylobacterium sp.]MCG9917522.1 TetR/AcrR family transcriptional regulator [Phenylobacterium sp.]